MNQCKCGSLAINHNFHGRDGSGKDLCDVCYWRTRAERDAGCLRRLAESAHMVWGCRDRANWDVQIHVESDREALSVDDLRAAIDAIGVES